MKNIFIRPLTLENITHRPLFFRLAFFYHCYLTKEMVPPPLFNFVGGEKFIEIGEGYFHYLKRFVGLKPEDSVLDIGCGIGRVAIPLTRYINMEGRYEGVDIVNLGIQWCNQKISRSFPWFHFQHANLHNKEYNPKGTVKAAEYRFPYQQNSFDVAFASSVFTHMFPDAVENYAREIHRVLKPGGRALCTFFILDDESRKHMDSSEFSFKGVQNEKYHVVVDFNPENAIAYDINDVCKFFTEQGFEIEEPIRFGSWSGRKNHVVSGQDMVVVRKKGSSGLSVLPASPSSVGDVELLGFETTSCQICHG